MQYRGLEAPSSDDDSDDGMEDITLSLATSSQEDVQPEREVSPPLPAPSPPMWGSCVHKEGDTVTFKVGLGFATGRCGRREGSRHPIACMMETSFS